MNLYKVQIEDLSGIREKADGDITKILADGEYTLNDIGLVADYYMSIIYHANYYLYKDFEIIEQQLLEENDIGIELIQLMSSYSSLGGKMSGSKARNGLPVLEEDRVAFEEAIYNLEELSLPGNLSSQE
ncbi:hypothetical protein ACTHPV_26475 [Ferdinandcohnia sp. SAFN-114]